MITQSSKFTKSKHFYAVDFEHPSTFRVEDKVRQNGEAYQLVNVAYPAVWFKEKNQILSAVKGTLRYLTSGLDDVSQESVLEDVMRNFDGRYGGNAAFRWDGQNLWAPQRTFAEMTEAQTELDSYLQNFPTIPSGYTGWYSIK